MNVQLTNAGVAALNANSGPVVLTSFNLGSAYNYLPEPTDIDIHGTSVWSGIPSAPLAVNANLVKYSIYLDYDVGDFDFGEFGIYMQNGDLFALGSGSTVIRKAKMSGTSMGNSIRLDVYLSMVGTNYEMWMDLAETNNQFRAAVFQSVDYIPPAKDAVPNIYVIEGASSIQSAFLAYTDRQGLWNFDGYKFSSTYTSPYTIVSANGQSVTIALDDSDSTLIPDYFGQKVLEFSTGKLFGICRYVKEYAENATTATLTFDTPLAQIPVAGDRFIVFSREPSANTIDLPIASATNLGAVKIGSGLAVDSSGLLAAIPPVAPVTSVAGKTGAVQLSVNDIANSVKTVNGTGPDANGNVAITPYTLPVATPLLLGGVKPGIGLLVNAQGDLTVDMASLPSAAVTSVNGKTGAVTIDPYVLAPATTLVLGGMRPGTGLKIDTNGVVTLDAAQAVLSVNGQKGNVTVSQYVLPKATTTTLGGITVGQGLVIDDGELSVDPTGLPAASVTSVNSKIGTVQLTGADIPGTVLTVNSVGPDANGNVILSSSYTLPTATGSVLGGVKVGQGLTIAGGGILSVDWSSQPALTLPEATDTVLGAIKLGAGLLAEGGGVVSVDFSAVPNIVTSVNGQTGNVSVPLYSLPEATDTVLGGVKIGSGINVDQGTISVQGYTLPKATDLILGGMRVGSGLLVDANGVVSLDESVLPEPGVPQVTSVNGQQGAVVLDVDDIGGAVKSVNGEVPDGNGDIVLSIPAPYTLPEATTSTLGGVIVGPGLTVVAGTVSLDTAALPVVTINGVSGTDGEVTLEANDIPGSTLSVNNIGPDVAGDVKLTASDVPGTVRSVNGELPDVNGDVVIDAGGVGTVTSVNGELPDGSGNVVLDIGTVKSVNGEVPDGTGNVTLSIPDGTVKSVNGQVPDGTGDVVLDVNDIGGSVKTVNGQSPDGAGNIVVPDGTVKSVNGELPDGAGNVVIDVGSTLAPATDTTLGGIMVGSGLSIDGSGVLSNSHSQYSPVNALTASFTLGTTHALKYNRCGSATAIDITVAAGTTSPVGTEFHFRQSDAGTVTFIASGTVINVPFGGTLVLAGVGATVTLKKVGADEFDLFGQVAAA